jgi:hypothetical protein
MEDSDYMEFRLQGETHLAWVVRRGEENAKDCVSLPKSRCVEERRWRNTEDVPATRAWFGNKHRAFAQHKVVKLRETYRSKFVKRYFPSVAKRAEHDVEAFWRNFNRNEHCAHEWPIMPDEHGHWHCPHCGQWRTRVREHKRGDSSIGVITKEYRV